MFWRLGGKTQMIAHVVYLFAAKIKCEMVCTNVCICVYIFVFCACACVWWLCMATLGKYGVMTRTGWYRWHVISLLQTLA
jgi:hypothetical protein